MIFLASYTPKKKITNSAYIISRDEKSLNGSNPEDLLFFGIQPVGKMNKYVKHWFNGAYVTGKRARDNDVRDIEAYGFDVGSTFIIDSLLEPSFTVGFAHGSGDLKRNQDKDNNFRQTDLQDNDYRFNGVTDFKYLGELFDPEITNISITTIGFGIRPSEKSSIDIVYHDYKQAEAVDRLTATNIDCDPQGDNAALGEELDIIIGYKEDKLVYVEGVLGVFLPGNAFKKKRQ